TLDLPAGWRQQDDIAWRASSWQLRQLGLGGMFTKPLSAEDRAEKKISVNNMALKVEHVGQYAPHDGAKKAGVQNGDILISYDGRTDRIRETDLLTYAMNKVPVGKSVPAVFLRGDEKISTTLPTSKGG